MAAPVPRTSVAHRARPEFASAPAAAERSQNFLGKVDARGAAARPRLLAMVRAAGRAGKRTVALSGAVPSGRTTRTGTAKSSRAVRDTVCPGLAIGSPTSNSGRPASSRCSPGARPAIVKPPPRSVVAEPPPAPPPRGRARMLNPSIGAPRSVRTRPRIGSTAAGGAARSAAAAVVTAGASGGGRALSAAARGSRGPGATEPARVPATAPAARAASMRSAVRAMGPRRIPDPRSPGGSLDRRMTATPGVSGRGARRRSEPRPPGRRGSSAALRGGRRCRRSPRTSRRRSGGGTARSRA